MNVNEARVRIHVYSRVLGEFVKGMTCEQKGEAIMFGESPRFVLVRPDMDKTTEFIGSIPLSTAQMLVNELNQRKAPDLEIQSLENGIQNSSLIGKERFVAISLLVIA